MQKKHTQGFTLIELAIVIVVMGLMIGGVLVGRHLLAGSQLQSVISEAQRYQSASQSFQDTYFALPGDVSNATQYWATSANGNGDGIINNAAGAGVTGESFRFWQHLALAGLIEGSYTGLAGASSATHSVLGINVPASKRTGVGWAAFSMGNFAGDANSYAFNYGNVFLLGGATATSTPTAAILTPVDALQIDSKIDDGKAGTGNVIAMYWNNLCAAPDSGGTTFSNTVSSYRTTDTALRCALYILLR